MAKRWWGSPTLAPARPGDGVFVLQHDQGRFGPGDAERHVPSMLSLVLPGATSPHRGNLIAVLDGGGIVVVGMRTTHQMGRPSRARFVRVRTHYALVDEAQSVTTGRKIRRVTWTVEDAGHYIRWNVLDLAKHRSLDELVHIVDALRES